MFKKIYRFPLHIDLHMFNEDSLELNESLNRLYMQLFYKISCCFRIEN